MLYIGIKGIQFGCWLNAVSQQVINWICRPARQRLGLPTADLHMILFDVQQNFQHLADVLGQLNLNAFFSLIYTVVLFLCHFQTG